VKERYWTNLIGSLQHGQCVFILGPEIPAKVLPKAPGAQPDESKMLIEGLRADLAKELQDDDHTPRGSTLAAIAQQYEDEYKSNVLQTTAARFYMSRTYSASSVHEKLAALPLSLIITTAQDDLLVQSLKAANKTPIVQRYNFRGDKRANPEFVIPDSPTAPLVYQLYGNAGEPSSLVLSENDILDFLIAMVSERPPLPNSLLSALKRKGLSFLFLGFGIRHWDLRIVSKLLLRALELNRSSDPIAAEPLCDLLQNDCDEVVYFYQRGTRVELEDTDIGQFLSQIATRLQAAGGYSEGQTAPLGTRPRVFISYAREDADLASRLFAALQKEYFDPWLDNEKLQGGENWDLHIKQDLGQSDFTLLVYSKAFCAKRDGYVNTEMNLAIERATQVRGSFLIPLRTFDITPAERVSELGKYNEMDLRPESFDEHVAKVISTMRREYQLRNP
jgi:hypothetical protein